jgi:hypothetical protein
MRVSALETASKLVTGVGIGVGIGFLERHSKQVESFFDPDSGADPDMHGPSLRNA